MKIKNSEKTLIYCLVISLIIQLGAVLYMVYFVPPQPRSDVLEMDNRFISVIQEREQQEPMEVEKDDSPEPVEIIEESELELEPQFIDEPRMEPEPELEHESYIEPESQLEVAETFLESPINEGGVAESVGATDGGDVSAMNIGDGTSGNGRNVRRGRERELREAEEEAERLREERITEIEEETTSPCSITIVSEPSIPYPRELREQGVVGVVLAQCIITPQGRVRACRLTSGDERLFDVVKPIIEQWRCNPMLDHNGDPQVSNFTFRIPFRARD